MWLQVLLGTIVTGWLIPAPPWLPNVTPPAGVEAPAFSPPPKRTTIFQSTLKQGSELLKNGRYGQARTALERAVSLCPQCPEARKLLARVLLTLGYLSWDHTLVKAAFSEIDQAVELNPRDRESLLLWRIIEQLVRRMERRPRSV